MNSLNPVISSLHQSQSADSTDARPCNINCGLVGMGQALSSSKNNTVLSTFGALPCIALALTATYEDQQVAVLAHLQPETDLRVFVDNLVTQQAFFNTPLAEFQVQLTTLVSPGSAYATQQQSALKTLSEYIEIGFDQAVVEPKSSDKHSAIEINTKDNSITLKTDDEITARQQFSRKDIVFQEKQMRNNPTKVLFF